MLIFCAAAKMHGAGIKGKQCATVRMDETTFPLGPAPFVSPPRFTIFLHQFTDAAPGAFLDFGSLGGKDSYSFARKP